MMKLKEASTISMEVMVYAACPVAFLLRSLSQMVFRQYFNPWKLVRSRIRPECCPGSCKDCKLKPISRVVQRTVPLQCLKTIAVKFRWRKSDRFKRRKVKKLQQKKFREQEQWLQSCENIKDKCNHRL